MIKDENSIGLLSLKLNNRFIDFKSMATFLCEEVPCNIIVGGN